jgi:hypothetical protein
VFRIRSDAEHFALTDLELDPECIPDQISSGPVIKLKEKSYHRHGIKLDAVFDILHLFFHLHLNKDEIELFFS